MPMNQPKIIPGMIPDFVPDTDSGPLDRLGERRGYDFSRSFD